VVPGNLGRNYITRMIIRRAYRFGGKIGLTEPFLARVAETVIEKYRDFYPELEKNHAAILQTITREEEQFQRTLDRATSQLNTLLDKIEAAGQQVLPGDLAADLYTTLGMPFEITRDIAQERGLLVDEKGFNQAIDAHRQASGAGKAMGVLGGEDVEVYRHLRDQLQKQGKLSPEGVIYNPYREPQDLEFESEILALVVDSQPADSAEPGDRVEVLLPQTSFYLESGGQVSDTGLIQSNQWEIRVIDMRQPAAGMIVHVGEVVRGNPKVGDHGIARVDAQRRKDIMRNHTATHLLHAALRHVLGPHARQAGSLVAPDRLRFDFTHPEALTVKELEAIQNYVNERVLENDQLNIQHKSLQEALEDGAVALFGEKYGEIVRNITIGDVSTTSGQDLFSNELCGGTHVDATGDIGTFMITSEGSVAAGIRRIEAVTGREAYKFIQQRLKMLNQASAAFSVAPDQLLEKTQDALTNLKEMRGQIVHLRQNLAAADFTRVLDNTADVSGVDVLTAQLNEADVDTLRQMADRFRQRHPENGVAVLASIIEGRPVLIAAVTGNLVKRGIKAGDLAGFIARQLGGGGGGKPTLAQAGGKDANKLDEALASVPDWVRNNLQ
jgi:alanyl-tRNA synthetase